MKGIDATSLRFFTVFGPRQRPTLAIKEFIDGVLQDKPVTLYGDGNQVRDFTYVTDICEGIKLLLDMKFGYQRVYNIGSEKCYSLYDIIGYVTKYLNKPITINYKPKLEWDVDSTCSNSSLLNFDTEWEPKVNFYEGLSKQIEWQKKVLKLWERKK
jgi:UDP-glucuronate 4-epimerase